MEAVAAKPTAVEPYYQHGGITIYHGDCREILPYIPKADLLLTDPPYGIGYAGSMKLGQSRFRWKQHAGGWDESRPTEETLSLALAAADKAIVWGGNFFPFLGVSPGWLIWNKVQRNFSKGEGELAWTNFLGSVRIFDLLRNQCIKDGKQHPTQKALSLIRWCLSFAPDAQTILDPFAGSCTTGIAAKLEGREAVLIELDERYCEIGAKRLQQEVLF